MKIKPEATEKNDGEANIPVQINSYSSLSQMEPPDLLQAAVSN